ncbi:MAG: ferredoxin, partial [Desulfuromonadales bacterium]|nr:ferredoxin [Desulfuromonadales bacterium]NIS41206.1 ferredoxin [Desulfuromonadales bacterium]
MRSVCSGCARGCSIKVWRRKKQWYVRSLDKAMNHMVYRVTPLENPEINGHWICNKGFDLHKFVARRRALHPQIAGEDAQVDETLEEAKRLLAEAKKPAVLVSAHASNEELETFKAALGARLAVYTREDYQAED